jgi:hypothetical protein
VERRQLERSQPPPEGLALFFVFLLLSVSAGAQSAEPKVTAALSNITRVESWSYFQPDPDALPPDSPAGNPAYTFLGDRAEVGVQVTGSRFDFGGAFNYVRLENLPENSIGPGGLGTGAFYFYSSGVDYSYQLYLGELTARIKSRDQRTSFTIGRMPFSSGGGSRFPLEPASPEPWRRRVEQLTSERIESRLIGNFEWSYYQRRFDGARFDLDRERWQLTAAAFMPTQGGFEESTNLTMPQIQVVDTSVTRKGDDHEYQAFAYLYRDRRDSKAVVDNSGSADLPVDVTIATFGGSYASVNFAGLDSTDLVVWGAVQAGDWYGRDHLAASVAVELGHRWSQRPLEPWLRGGFLWASGDADGDDGRHGTFFQMLPSSRKYALSSVYAQMNVRDLFAQLLIEPRRFKARIEVHALHLANDGDLWYQGSGATASHGRFFGFSGRTSGGRTSLGSLVEGSVDVPIRKYWSINGYTAVMSAGDVVEQMFTNKRLTLWSIENVLRF